MSLLQASNIMPSTLAPAGNSTVAAADNIKIQWQINGTSPMYSYQIDVMQNDVNSTLVHTTGVLPANPSRYGTDGKGNITPFVYEPSSTTWLTWGLTNGNTYKLKIIQIGGTNRDVMLFTCDSSPVSLTQGSTYQFYNSITGKYYIFVSPANISLNSMHIFPGNLVVFNYLQTIIPPYATLRYTTLTPGTSSYASSILGTTVQTTATDCVMQNTDVAFNTRTAPVVSIASITNDTITDITYTFTATYSQAQSDSISWVRWVLTDADGAIVDDTGKITTGVLSYTYDGLLDDIEYSISCIVETQNGVQATDTKTFGVEYEIDTDTQSLTSICTYESDGSAVVRWSLSSVIAGTATGGNVTYENGFVQIPASAAVGWTTDFENPYQIAWCGKLTISPGVKNILKINGTQTLTLSDTAIGFGLNSVFIPYEAITNAAYMTVLLRDTGIAIWFYDAYGNRMFDCDTISYFTTGLASSITSLELYGAQECYWLCVTANTTYAFPNASVFQKPTIDSNTHFLASFDNTLDALGWADAGSSGGSSWHIYRESVTDGTLQHVMTASGTVNTIKDYGIKSNNDYKYNILLRSSTNVWRLGISSAQICRRLTSYYLYEATEDPDYENTYRVINVWRFGNNYNGGSVSNGNAPQFLANFTKYPLRQASTSAAKSGTLTALLSNFAENNEYTDTAAQMEALYNLSLSQNHIFLKDTKGNLYEVHTSAPISQTINTITGVQEVTVSIPWQEIADASGISLYSTLPITTTPLFVTTDGEYEAPTGFAYTPVSVSVELTVYGDLLDDTWGS